LEISEFLYVDLFKNLEIGRVNRMRFVLRLKGPRGPVGSIVYRQKLEIIRSILNVLRSSKFMRDLSFSWVVFQGPSRSIFNPEVEFVVNIFEELIPRKKLRELDIDEALNEIIRAIEKLWRRGEAEKTPILRDSEVIIGFHALMFDHPITGTIHIRGSGNQRRDFGDIEIIPYYAKNEVVLEDMSQLYMYMIEAYGDEIAKEYLNVTSRFIHEIESIKYVLIQPLDTNVSIDYDQVYAASYKDIRTHLAMVIRFMKKKRKEVIASKVAHGVKDIETFIYKKLSKYISLNGLYTELAKREKAEIFRYATIKVYSEQNILASGHSLILASLGKHTLYNAYNKYLEDVISPIVSEFPEDDKFEKWIDQGFNVLRDKVRGKY